MTHGGGSASEMLLITGVHSALHGLRGDTALAVAPGPSRTISEGRFNAKALNQTPS